MGNAGLLIPGQDRLLVMARKMWTLCVLVTGGVKVRDSQLKDSEGQKDLCVQLAKAELGASGILALEEMQRWAPLPAAASERR